MDVKSDVTVSKSPTERVVLRQELKKQWSHLVLSMFRDNSLIVGGEMTSLFSSTMDRRLHEWFLACRDLVEPSESIPADSTRIATCRFVHDLSSIKSEQDSVFAIVASSIVDRLWEIAGHYWNMSEPRRHAIGPHIYLLRSMDQLEYFLWLNLIPSDEISNLLLSFPDITEAIEVEIFSEVRLGVAPNSRTPAHNGTPVVRNVWVPATVVKKTAYMIELELTDGVRASFDFDQLRADRAIRPKGVKACSD